MFSADFPDGSTLNGAVSLPEAPSRVAITPPGVTWMWSPGMAPPGVLRRNMENCAASLWANRNCAETWPGDGLDPEVSLVLRYREQ